MSSPPKETNTRTKEQSFYLNNDLVMASHIQSNTNCLFYTSVAERIKKRKCNISNTCNEEVTNTKLSKKIEPQLNQALEGALQSRENQILVSHSKSPKVKEEVLKTNGHTLVPQSKKLRVKLDVLQANGQTLVPHFKQSKVKPGVIKVKEQTYVSPCKLPKVKPQVLKANGHNNLPQLNQLEVKPNLLKTNEDEIPISNCKQLMKPKLLEKNGHTLVPELNQSIVEPNMLETTERQILFKELEVKLELLKTNDEITVQQCKLKKELKVLVEKLSPDILSQISTKSYYKEELIFKSPTKLKCSIEALLNEIEDSIVIAELDEDAHIPSEILIPVGQLEILSSEAAESKMNNATSSISTTHLVKLLKILEKNIQNGMSVSLISNHDDEDESELFLEMALERIMRAVYASLIGFYIMASSNMPKIIYLEDFIEKVIQFTQYQLKNSVFPSFDPQCRTISKDKVNGKSKKHKTNAKELKISHERLLMYKKMAELVTLLAELINVQVLTDNSLLHASSIGVAIFFVNNIEQIQLSSLNLVTTIFMKHENHQRLILDDILSSLVRLSGGKNCLRTFKLQSGEYIQMFTALVLQLIQCTIYIPDHLLKSLNFDVNTYILKKYEIARKAAAYFLSMFLEKCGSKSEDTCFRTLFDNFVLDLFMVFTKPEWPCAELMINLLGKLLVSKFITKEVDMTLRTASLDIIGIIAVNLRKNSLLLQQRLTTMDNIFQEIKAMGEIKLNNLFDENNYLLQVPEYEHALYLQSALVDYLSRSSASDQTFTHSRLFYLASWYQDVLSEQKKESHVKKVSKNKEKKYKDKHKNEDSKSANHSQINTELRANFVEIQKQFTMKSIVGICNSNKNRPFDKIAHTLVDYKSVELICLYLFCKSSSSTNFDIYLNRVSSVLADSSIAIRTKALKCLTTIVEVDPNVLGMKEMQNSVKNSFFDQSSSVREAAVDLVGKFIFCQPDLINMYYEMIAPRILDTSVSVRKRVIRIFKEICMTCPEFPKIEDICLKMIHRVSDEDGIKKLVVEAFQNIFFTPIYEKHESNSSALLYKVNIISRVVSECSDVALDLFEKLLENLFRPEDNRHELIKHRMKVKLSQNCVIACQQIIDTLVTNVEKLEPSFVEHKQSPESSKLVLMYFSTMHLFAKVHPLLLMNHGATLQPYLMLKCLNPEDYQIISCVARLFELVVPIMENPSEPFLSQLQDNFLCLISQHDCAVVSSSVSCLATIVNNMTHNFALVRACFEKYYICLCRFKDLHSQAFSRSVLERYISITNRAAFVIGLLFRYFDFTSSLITESLPEDIKDKVFETLVYFVQHPEAINLSNTLKALGYFSVQHYEFLLGTELKSLYHTLLTENTVSHQVRIQVLNNIHMYLQEEETRMVKHDKEWSKLSKNENLKEMGDISSGMASSVIQFYLEDILKSTFHPNSGVRQTVLTVVQSIIQQGLVHPIQIVPYLICMGTDVEETLRHFADEHLLNIEKKYPGFIHMKSYYGIHLSFKLQSFFHDTNEVKVTRGFRLKEDREPFALNAFLYSLLRTSKRHRRAFLHCILKQFDEQENTSLPEMLYLSDNLAYFPYQVQDELLFILHHINITTSVSGTSLLDAFHKQIQPNQNVEKFNFEEEVKEEDILSCVSEDNSALQDFIIASQGCLLLLLLREHLKKLYGISDTKIGQYNPSESSKVYDKPVNRKSKTLFDPKPIIESIKQMSNSIVNCDTSRKILVKQYTLIKKLIIQFDNDVEENEKYDKVTKEQESFQDSNETRHSEILNPTQSLANSVHQQTPL